MLTQQNPTQNPAHDTIGTSALAHKGNSLSALIVNSKKSGPWMVDSGASDHMTGDAALFHDYSLSRNNLTVKIADGSLSKVVGTSSIIISKDLVLNSVLHVPKLECNLLSVNKLIQEHRCVTKFFFDVYEFQDLDSGRTIGSAKVCSGLYLLKVGKSPRDKLIM